MSAKNTPETFWARVRRAGANECWLWLGSRIHGYGNLKYQGNAWVAHRLAWTISNGQIPSDLCVLHRCDNPPCCNPKHLFLGTRLDNNRDRMLKGRGGDLKGTKQGNAKLTDEAVRFIRKNKKLSGPELARRFGVQRAAINKVRRGETWKHL